MITRQRLIQAAVTSGVMLLIASCSPEQTSESPQASPPRSTNTPPADAGVRVFIDPATGDIRDPTPEEAAALAKEQEKAAVARTNPPQKPREIVHPDGTVEVILDGSHDQALQACVLPDGSIKTEHACNTPATEKQK